MCAILANHRLVRLQLLWQPWSGSAHYQTYILYVCVCVSSIKGAFWNRATVRITILKANKYFVVSQKMCVCECVCVFASLLRHYYMDVYVCVCVVWSVTACKMKQIVCNQHNFLSGNRTFDYTRNWQGGSLEINATLSSINNVYGKCV